jgi:hypothetical protein
MKFADADAELGAYGIANIVAAMFAAPLSVGIPARSLAVVRCGGTTRLANILHAVFLLGFLWLGAGFVAHIPLPALAGVTAWMGLCLLDWSAWRRLPKMSRVDAAAFLLTAFSPSAARCTCSAGEWPSGPPADRFLLERTRKRSCELRGLEVPRRPGGLPQIV